MVSVAGGGIGGSGGRSIHSVSGFSAFGASTAGAAAVRENAPQAQAAPAEGLDKVTVLAGTWKTDGQRFDTDFSKAGHDTSTLRNHCWRSGEFYACDQFVNGASKVLIVFSFNASDGTYNSYAIPAGGKPAFSGKLKIDGETWTYENPQTADSKPPYFRTINVFEDSSTIHFTVQYAHDNQHWITMNQGIETRQK
jgi:hypothetical protein